MVRNKKCRKTTTYKEREVDWRPHDLIVNELCKYPDFLKTSKEKDHKGADYTFYERSFDLKVTDHLPRTYRGESIGYPLFVWNLEHQDLDYFHDTNRVIVIVHKEKWLIDKDDAQKIAYFIQNIPLSNYYQNIKYTLKGCKKDRRHRLYNKQHIMRFGLLVHYKNNQCFIEKTSPPSVDFMQSQHEVVLFG